MLSRTRAGECMLGRNRSTKRDSLKKQAVERSNSENVHLRRSVMRSRFCLSVSVLSLVALLVLVASGCGGNYGCGAGYTVSHPALEVTAAKNARTGAPVSRVVLSDILLNGSPVPDPQYYLVPERLARGVVLEGDTLVCDVPCAFGKDAGTYQFTISAPGYKPTRAEFKGGPIFNSEHCYSHTIGSTQVQFALQPE